MVVQFVPFAQRADKMEEPHHGFGHPGTLNMYDLLRKRFWWPQMKKDLMD
jgi:hypothetical protein